MANKQLFNTIAGLLSKTDAKNEAGGTAYALSAEHALAQYAATGCLNATFYVSAEQQLESILDLCGRVDESYLARTAIWSRTRGYMKDVPALLCSALAGRNGSLCESIFPTVIDNGHMLKNFVQIMRSGVTGRRSLGTRPKRMVQRWLDAHSDESLFNMSVGNDPSLADIIKMVHPRPRNMEREALYSYLIGKACNESLLPGIVTQYESFKLDMAQETPNVPFQLLTALELNAGHWVQIARNAPWQMTRMNLNTFARHGVFEVSGMDVLIADRLRDPALIRAARVFPYQLMAAYMGAGPEVPQMVREALHDAMEIATENVPEFEGTVYVFADVSGSMHSPISGIRRGSTSVVQCIDVAALISACVLRRNVNATVIPFHSEVVSGWSISPKDTIMTNARLLAALPQGGTNCSAPLAYLNKRKAKGDLLIYVSDNESWVDSRPGGRNTATMFEWESFKKRNPSARMACIDLQPSHTVQAPERNDILNIGGFSDQVFALLADFAAGRLADGHWVEMIGEVELPGETDIAIGN